MRNFSSGFLDMFPKEKSGGIVRRDPLQHFFGLRSPKNDKVRAFFVSYFLGFVGIPLNLTLKAFLGAIPV